MLNETGNLVAAVADMDCFDAITPDFVESNEQLLEGAACVVLDGNLSEPTLKAACLVGAMCPMCPCNSLCLREAPPRRVHWSHQ
jgi:hypothetical protein